MQHLEDWDDFVATRYREGKSQDEFRNYKPDANPTVTEFYRQNHAYQTFEFVIEKKAEYCGLRRGKKSIWEMAEYLNTLVDARYWRLLRGGKRGKSFAPRLAEQDQDAEDESKGDQVPEVGT